MTTSEKTYSAHFLQQKSPEEQQRAASFEEKKLSENAKEETKVQGSNLQTFGSFASRLLAANIFFEFMAQRATICHHFFLGKCLRLLRTLVGFMTTAVGGS